MNKILVVFHVARKSINKNSLRRFGVICRQNIILVSCRLGLEFSLGVTNFYFRLLPEAGLVYNPWLPCKPIKRFSRRYYNKDDRHK